MKTSRGNTFRRSGFSLLETVIALGVLAVSVPLVFLALEEGSRSGMASATDSRGGRMVHVCLEEIRASREGRAHWFSNTSPGETIPPEGEVWALAFSNEGRAIGKITPEQWNTGVVRMDGQPVRYLTRITSQPHGSAGLPEMHNVRVTVEDPAGAPAGKRRKSGFHTFVP
jgi:type II secretory pathway pseudopilin PulG